MFDRIILRLRIALGHVPNVEWLRVEISRAVVLDRARAHAATAELERCLRLRRTGGRCARLGAIG
jgi:hypothetical protein